MGKLTWVNLGHKIEAVLIWLSVFLMPWQLRHTLMFAQVNGGYFEYGSWHIYASDGVILFLLLVGLIVARGKGFRPLPMAVGRPLLMILVWMTMTIFWAADRGAAINVVLHWWLFYGWCVYLVNRVQKIEQLLWPLVIGTGVQAGWGIAQYVLNHSVGWSWLGESILDPTKPGASVIELAGERHLRAYGLLPHPNMLGGILLTGIMAGLVLVQQQLVKWKWVVVWVIGMVLATGLALSFSRVVWIIFVIAVVVMGIVGLWKKQAKVLIMTGLMLLVFAGVLASQWRYVVTRFDLSQRLEQQSVQERQLGYSEWQQIVSRYSTKGVGAGNYAINLTQIESGRAAWWYAPVHNIYLLITAELGVIGIAMWVWFVVALGKWWWSRRRTAGVGLVLPMLTWLGCGLTDHWLVSLQQGQLLFFLALTLLFLGYRNIIQGEQEG